MLKEINEKAINSIEAFKSNELKLVSDRDKEDMKAYELFNEMAQQYGYAERIHVAKLLIGGKIHEIKFVNAGDNSFADTNLLYPIEWVDDKYFKNMFDKNLFELDGLEISLTKGENNLTTDEAFMQLLNKIYNSKCKVDLSNDINQLIDENGVEFLEVDDDYSAEIYVALFKGDFKYINGGKINEREKITTGN